MATDPQYEYGRRHFLKDSLVSVVKTAHEFTKHRDAPSEQSESPAFVREDWLRPPGAVPESMFLDRCTRCGDCAKACPHSAVTVHPRNGFPILLPDQTPCYLCDDVPCIAACETDALVAVQHIEDVRMGLAVVSPKACTAEQGCNACVSQCPTHALSMDFDVFRVIVSESRCVGCGICEYTCKSVNDRIAITVRPARSSAA
jgi:ferredoxin-type protein NapG